jgi:oxygen-dependent protoporphyrinogen oxidase
MHPDGSHFADERRTMQRVVIVGAGITGLALAYRLAQLSPTLEITVLESRDRPGGTVWTERRDGFQVEIGPNGFLDNSPSTMRLCADVGLADQLVPASVAASRNRFLFVDGKLKLLPRDFIGFLKSDLLSWRGKLGVLTEPVRRRRVSLDDESIDSFVRRRLGQEVARTLADALVTGIHAGDPALLSVRAAMPRLAFWEDEHRSMLVGMRRAARARRLEAARRGEPKPGPVRMWSMGPGLRLLIETLCQALPKAPLCGISVRRIEKTAEGWIVRGEGRDSWPADAVVLACPAFAQAAILADLDGELAARVGGIAYNRVAVVALGYRTEDIRGNVEGFGFIAPQNTRRDILGVQWCSSIYPGRAPGGMVLFRALCGGWNRPEVVDWPDQRLLAAVGAELRLAQGIEAPPLFHHIVRWEHAIPQYHVGHLERVAWIEGRTARHAGLHLTGNSYRGVALNDCTREAQRLARAIADSPTN